MRFLFLIPLVTLAAAVLPLRVMAVEDFTILPLTAQPPDGCVGDPVTPLCAIQTYWACHAWARRGLCRTIGYTTKYVRGGFAGLGALGVYKLRIVDQRPLESGDIPKWTGNVGLWVKEGIQYEPWRPGDLAVRLEFWDCTPDDKCVTPTRDDPTKQYGEGCPPDHSCTRSEIDKSLVLRRVGPKWRLLYYHFDPDDHGAFWEAFWNRK